MHIPVPATSRNISVITITIYVPCSVADPDPVGSGPFSQIWSNFPDPVPDPDPTIKSHITRSKSNKLNRYFCEQFTFLK